MSDEIEKATFASSSFGSDLRKQQEQKAFLSAQNIRKVSESVDEYNARMAKYREELNKKVIDENTDILRERLSNLDVSSIATKNRIAIEQLIAEAQSIKFFAYNNRYNASAIDLTMLEKTILSAQARLYNLKNTKSSRELGTGIFADTYRKCSDDDDILSKLLKNKNQG